MENQELPELDLYETLQVSRRADADVIEAAYRALARRYHPDLNGSPGATAQMSLINGAWETLRDPERRAEYDRRMAGVTLTPASPTAPAPPATEANTAGPVLVIEPARLVLGVVRRGSRRVLNAGVYTAPPGIRVEAAVASGSGWLSVSPAVLTGLDQERVGVGVRTRGLPPGTHRGAVEFSTSWERRLLPVEVEVQAAALPFRVASLLRHGPAGGWRDSTATAIFAVLLLAVIIAALVVLAVGR